MGLRDQLLAEGPKPSRRGAASRRRSSRTRSPTTWSGTASPAAPACTSLPGLDRAHRPHRRPAPPPGDGRRPLPGRGRPDAARRRALVQPLGQGPVRAGRVGGGARRAGARAGRPGARGALLGRLRGVVRRARQGSRPSRRRSCCRRPGVDFAILGPREACTGDPARRMGNEYVFQAFAEQNVETLNETGAGKIVTRCPHCFNTLANEYPDFGGSYEVVHHTELLAELVREGRITPGGGDKADHLPRLLLPGPPQRRAAEPRELVEAVGTPVEMERTGKQTFCCGAGGAHMWMEERGRGDQRGARPRGGRDRRRHAGGRLPLLHDHARRRRPHLGPRAARGRRGHAARGIARGRLTPWGQAPDGAWPRWFAQPRGLTPMLRGTRLRRGACSPRSGQAPDGAWPRLFALFVVHEERDAARFAAGVDLLAVEQRCGLLGDVHVDAALVDHLVGGGR